MKNRDPWQFLRRRGEQLYLEGDVRRALRLLRYVSDEQALRFAQEGEKQTKKLLALIDDEC